MDSEFLDKFDPRWLLKDLAKGIGEEPDPSIFFAKKRDHYLIHSSKSATQNAFGFFLIAFGELFIYFLYGVFLTHAVVRAWSPEQIAELKIISLFVAILLFLVSILVLTIKRETWLDESLSEITVVNGAFFISKKTVLKKSRVVAVRLIPEYPHRVSPHWDVRIETASKEIVPVTLKHFSYHSYSGLRLLDIAYQPGDYSVAKEISSAAYAFARALNVPLRLITDTYQLDVTNEKSVAFSEDVRKEMEAKHVEAVSARAKLLKNKVNQLLSHFSIIIVLVIAMEIYDYVKNPGAEDSPLSELLTPVVLITIIVIGAYFHYKHEIRKLG